MNIRQAVFAVCDKLPRDRGFDTHHGQVVNFIKPEAEKLCGRTISLGTLYVYRSQWRQEILNQQRPPQPTVWEQAQQAVETATLEQTMMLVNSPSILKLTTKQPDAFVSLDSFKAACLACWSMLQNGSFKSLDQLQDAIDKAKAFASQFKAA
jgi:hypothetical protein